MTKRAMCYRRALCCPLPFYAISTGATVSRSDIKYWASVRTDDRRSTSSTLVAVGDSIKLINLQTQNYF